MEADPQHGSGSYAPQVVTCEVHAIALSSPALVEGGAFANLVAVFTHGYGPSLVLAAVLMSMIVLRFPTWNRYLERIEAEMRRMEESAGVNKLRS